MSEVIYDVDSSQLLRASGSTALTATTALDAVEFDMSAGGNFAVAMHVSAVKTNVGDETYIFSVQGADAAGANGADLYTLAGVGAVGEYLIPVNARTAVKILGEAGCKTTALKLTATGTSPSITFAAWITQIHPNAM